MAENESALKKQFDDALLAARKLRDEIRVELHLASMDAQDRWKKIEPALYDTERLGTEVTETAKKAASDVAKSFRDFLDTLKRRSAESH